MTRHEISAIPDGQDITLEMLHGVRSAFLEGVRNMPRGKTVHDVLTEVNPEIAAARFAQLKSDAMHDARSRAADTHVHDIAVQILKQML